MGCSWHDDTYTFGEIVESKIHGPPYKPILIQFMLWKRNICVIFTIKENLPSSTIMILFIGKTCVARDDISDNE